MTPRTDWSDRETTTRADHPLAQRLDSEPTIGELAKAASRDMSNLLRAEIELAKVELRDDVKAAARAGVLFAVAAVSGVFVLFMLLIAFAEGLVAAGLWRWVAYLVVAAVLMVLAGVGGLIGIRSIKKVGPPQRTIATARGTLEWARHPTQQPVTVRRDGGPTAVTVPPDQVDASLR